jgi:hypothetical protein
LTASHTITPSLNSATQPPLLLHVHAPVSTFWPSLVRVIAKVVSVS